MASLLIALACSKSQAMNVSQNGDYVVLANANGDEYADLLAELWGNGPVPDFRPVWVNFDWFTPSIWTEGESQPNPPPHWAINAVFKKNTEDLVVAHFFGLDATTMEDHVDSCHANGFEMMQVEAYETPSGPWYAYIAYQQSGPEWEALIGFTEEGFKIIAGSLEGGFQYVNHCRTYGADSKLEITALFKKDGTAAYLPPETLSYDEMNDLYATLEGAGYAITSMEVVAGNQFLPVFKIKYGGEFLVDDWEHGVTSAELAELNATVMLGLRPVLISNIGLSLEVPYTYALWREPPRPRRQPAGSKDQTTRRARN